MSRVKAKTSKKDAVIADPVLRSVTRHVRDRAAAELEYMAASLAEELADPLGCDRERLLRALEDFMLDASVSRAIADDLLEDEEETKDAPAPAAATPAVGDRCLAVLKEDGEWHPAEVREVISVAEYRVVFTEYNKPQVVASHELRLEAELAKDDDEELGLEGTCKMCERTLPLTRHHLIPRTTHPRFKKKVPKNVLVATVDICRPCHNVVHSVGDEMTLALHFNTLEKLMALEEVQKWIRFAQANQHRKLSHQA